MGTGWTLLAVSPPDGVARGVQAALDRVVAQMSQWEPDSDLSRFNNAAPGRWQSLPPEFSAVLEAAQAVSRASGGAFDPAMGAFTEAWGFGTAPPPVDEPDVAAIVRGAIEFDALGLRARRMGQAQLDFSGIAKGFGVDLAAEWLIAQGLRHFLLEVGGELRGEGVKPDGEPWWVDVECPPGSRVAPLRAALHRLSIATSGDYRRWLDRGGTRHGHTLDPRSGRPLANGMRSVTVLHPRCMLADVWATALTVLGPDEGMRVADEQDLAVQMIAADREYLSAAMERMLD